jgi:poly(beta-D-mannuronate) lyase
MKPVRLLSLLLLILPIPANRCAAEKDLFKQAEVRDTAASFFDLAVRRGDFATATNPRLRDAIRDAAREKNGCIASERPAPPAGRMTIPHHYLSGSNGPVNPEEAKAAEPYRKLQNTVSKGASRYLATGDPAEAVCVANLLANWAKAGALLDYTSKESSQAWFQVEWTLGSISLAYSAVQSETSIPAEERKAILAWMRRATEYMFSQNRNDDPAHENNHAYWRAMAATSVGILAGDNALYRRGLEQYARALAQMNPDGSLPLEMARHENALAYQSFALAPLATIAELAARQGVDLYSLRVKGHSLGDGVAFLLRAADRPEIVKRYAVEEQTFSFHSGKNPPAWLEFWARRNPGPPWDTLLTKPLFDSNLGGNVTLYAAPADN